MSETFEPTGLPVSHPELVMTVDDKGHHLDAAHRMSAPAQAASLQAADIPAHLSFAISQAERRAPNLPEEGADAAEES